MKTATGRTRSLSPHRRTVVDMMHFAKRMPAVAVQKKMRLGPLIDARQQCAARPTWVALFIKAFALVARRYPALRQAYLPFPRPRFYEHNESVASFTAARDDSGEDIVVIGHCPAPENQTIDEIDARIRACQTDPLPQIASYRRCRRLSRWPWPVRRFFWWLGTQVLGRVKARQFGTFGISSTAALGVDAFSLLTVLTSTLHYGLFEPDGSLDMPLTFDHRVFDGALAARILLDLEQTLLTDILAEVQSRAVAHAA